MLYNRTHFTDSELLQAYQAMLLARMASEKIQLLLKNKPSIENSYLGIGQEALFVGALIAIHPSDWVLPQQYINTAICTERHLPLTQWINFIQNPAVANTPAFFQSALRQRIVPTVAPSEAGLSIANGIAWAAALKQENIATIAFTNEYGMAQGSFHEAIHQAVGWNLPVLFIVENNGQQHPSANPFYRSDKLMEKAYGYGIEAVRVDGNNILNVIDTLRGVRTYCVEHKKPYLIECHTSIAQQALYNHVHTDPLTHFQEYLSIIKVLSDEMKSDIVKQHQQTIHKSLTTAIALVSESKQTATPAALKTLAENPQATPPINHTAAAIQCMEEDPCLIFFKILDDTTDEAIHNTPSTLLKKFGTQRVWCMPPGGQSVLEVAIGLGLNGFKTWISVDFTLPQRTLCNQFMHQLMAAADQAILKESILLQVIIQSTARPTLGYYPVLATPFASANKLRMLYGPSAQAVQQLLKQTQSPQTAWIIFDETNLHRPASTPVSDPHFTFDIDTAQIVRTGTSLTIVTYGQGVSIASQYVEKNPTIDIEIIDLCTVYPLDYNTIAASIQKTGKLLLLHPPHRLVGIDPVLRAGVAEHCFYQLDVPITSLAMEEGANTAAFILTQLHHSIQYLLNR